MKKKISITINERTLSQIESRIDGLRIRSISQSIEELVEKALREDRTAIILATTPIKANKKAIAEKPLLTVNGLTIIEHAISKLVENKFQKIYIVGHHFTLTGIYDKIGDGSKYGEKITYVEEEPLSWNGIKKLAETFNGPLLVAFCDIVFDEFDIEELWNQHIRSKALATLLINTNPPKFAHKELTVKVKGRKIIEFSHMDKQDFKLYFAGVFVAEPEMLKGTSNFESVFFSFAKTGMVNAYIQTTNYYHIHTKLEEKRLKAQLRNRR